MAQATFDKWRTAFARHVSDLPSLGSDIHYEQSAARLRTLLASEVLRLTDLRRQPQRFFEAHRLLSAYATKLGPGFGIRFTVQFNLFAGTILALGSQEQVAALDEMQRRGVLGCFALTEKLAGVNSGLVVNTTCTWDAARQCFDLHSPDEAAHKNWISQGCTARKCVVLANVIVAGEAKGPHAFVMDLRRADGSLAEGVSVGDMGDKTIGNDLDNAWISFNHVQLPRDALLNKYADIDSDGRYVCKVTGMRMFEQIGQRLYTGRVVIAASTLCFARNIFKSTQEYTDAKQCWTPSGKRTALSQVPQLASLYDEADRRLSRLEHLIEHIEGHLCECLLGDKLPSPTLVDLVAAAKVRCIETAISLCFRLKQEVGSFALMGGTGFDKLDYLQCCKFAEGDSRILMQKIARDRMAKYARALPKDMRHEDEIRLCAEIAEAMAAAKSKWKAWNGQWEKVYELASVCIDHSIDDALGVAKPTARL